MVDHDVGEAAHDDVGAACGIIHGVRRRDDVVQLLQARTQHLHDNLSLGAEGNTGDTLALAEGVGAELANLDQAWWFPAVAPAAEGQAPAVMLAERSLPGSLIVDETGKRFINEATDYMSFGQEALRREREGDPLSDIWLVFDQQYRNSYVFAGGIFPRQPLPQAWASAGRP